jgi:hypothetical protein
MKNLHIDQIDKELKQRLIVNGIQIRYSDGRHNDRYIKRSYFSNNDYLFALVYKKLDKTLMGNGYIKFSVNNDPKKAIFSEERKKSNDKRIDLSKLGTTENEQFDYLIYLLVQLIDMIIDDEKDFSEGREIERIHKYRERNSKVVKIAKANFKKKHGKLFCQVCGVNFEEKYGNLGKNFIEAHHLIPVSKRGGVFNVSPKDFAIVCPNCHRMIHRKKPWLESISELKLILRK